MIILAYSLSLSLKIITTIIKRKSIDFKIIMNKYGYVLIVSSIIILITTLFEVFITPLLIKLTLTFIK